MKQLFKAIHSVYAAVHTIEKKGENKHHRYNYAMEEDTLKTVRPAMIQHGLIMPMVGFEIINISDVGKFTRFDLQVEYMLAHTSGDYLNIKVPASGIDTMDKGIPKALSMALKYAYFQVFNLAKGDDPDHTHNTSIEENMILLAVPFKEKDEVKKLGARWNKEQNKWQCFESQKQKFAKWLPYDPTSDKSFLSWTNQHGGLEKLQDFLDKKGYPSISTLSKERISKLKAAVESGSLQLEYDVNR
tara:strand:+ start:1147 stop:1878 length:732 start_codon:yes stop_codon:yes gene_type:complete